jgi:hypothetical protein
MFHMDRETKVFTVTPTSDVPLSGQRSKGQLYMAKILNNVRFCSGLLHLVCIDKTRKKSITPIKSEVRIRSPYLVSRVTQRSLGVINVYRAKTLNKV